VCACARALCSSSSGGAPLLFALIAYRVGVVRRCRPRQLCAARAHRRRCLASDRVVECEHRSRRHCRRRLCLWARAFSHRRLSHERPRERMHSALGSRGAGAQWDGRDRCGPRTRAPAGWEELAHGATRGREAYRRMGGRQLLLHDTVHEVRDVRLRAPPTECWPAPHHPLNVGLRRTTH
jgi:hypothetical protein